MLSISQPLSGSACGTYYTGGGAEGYYTNPLESQGEWFGSAAEKLRLKGAVNPRAFQRLLSGFSVKGNAALVQNAGAQKRQSAWDLTFSAPKSVSVLWALASEAFRKDIAQCHREAVQASLRTLEQTAGITRRGKGGAIKERAALLFALFTHGTSRALDPQLHTHAVLVNLALRMDGTTGTLQSRDIFRAKMEAGGLYRTELAARLEQRLALQIEVEKAGFHIRGVPKNLCDEFSKRRRAIVKSLREHGRDGAIAAKVAALDTRSKKLNISDEKLFALWQARGVAHGWGAEQAEELIRACVRKSSFNFQQRNSSKNSTNQEGRQTRQREQERGKTHSTHQEAGQTFAENQRTSREARKNIKRAHTGRGFFRVEWRTLFPKAPHWSPGRGWKLPIITFPKPQYQKWGYIEWKKSLQIASINFGEFRVQQRRLFPHAPKWSPVHGLSFPALRFLSKESLSKQVVQNQYRSQHGLEHGR